MKPCYCINPDCSQPEHPSNNNSNTRYCQSCGSQLLLNGKYRVSRLLSDTTGFGIVYEAFEGFTAKILKVLQEKWNNEPKAVELFKREYDVLLELSRQNVTGVPRADAYFQYSTREGKILHCLVMEKVEVINLEQWLNQYDKLSQKRALKWLREITLILDKIHQQNWLHRDIKPPNIMLRNSGELVLIDFGTAREETQTYHQKVKGQQVTGITSAGYTPNEQQHGQAVIQSDFHALGRTFVHLLTGKHPLEIYDPINDVLPWREETENIHPLLLDFIDELMGKLPENRPANTRVILQRLDEIERQLKLPPITPTITSPPPNPQPVVTQKQSPVIPKINSSVSPLDKTLTGHSYRVNSVVYSPDGRYLASGSSDKTIKIWEVATGKELRTLTGHSDWVMSVAYSPDGRYLASGSSDNTIKIWEVATGKQLHTLTGHSSGVLSVVYSPDGRYLASGSYDKTIKIWEVATGKELRTLTGHSRAVWSVVYSPDGRYLASGSSDKTIKIWEVATGKELRTLTGHSYRVYSVAYSPDGRYLASGGDDDTIKIWEVATGKELRTLTGHSNVVRSVAYSPDGRYLASGSHDNTIKIWEVATGKELRTLTGHSETVLSVAYSPDGRYLASGSVDDTIKIWRVGQ
ncbi:MULTISPECIES: serine/threonine-protein kinase [unclassified Microcystis]|uniref:serine/threonine-protein kinase n=4 Tax=Microcystis TaxID=1125 RepID=UPI00257A1E44|nr:MULTISPECIES: serine/threonine-protein kinase [unclassified Microcystis]MCA2899793.1 serine/threonine protein kinase [Microcystis sp. M035S1]MCA2721359.1 serine/threonine protein kinase [Microcystis sp. M176S2]MCA2727539.1 serine/threonine protein kinase [Microcystis sp. M166S2]MCA2728500.1 serine/threonine protein kinase [Microcystis sp. M162S2]MCA2745500.1 serine/threonine protein kinase [Microcystis sp. M155S2]